MPRKLRELIAELEKAGWRNTGGGKGSQGRPAGGAKMKTDYLKFVLWSAADRLFVGYCPDLFIGGVCHGSDEQRVYRELSRLVNGEIAESERARRALPRKRALVTMPVAV